MAYPITDYQRILDAQRRAVVKDELEQVKPLYKKGFSIRDISRLLSLDEKTVERRIKTLERLKTNDPKKYERIKERETITWFRG